MYDIRYSIVKFKAEFLQDSNLNINKNSAIRGILGTSLMSENCIMPRESRVCKECSYNSRCIAHSVISPKIKSGEGDEGVSPFVIICDDKREHIKAGEIMEFAMIFFGDRVSYIPLVIKAMYRAGRLLGFEKNFFKIIGAYNDEGNEIYNGRSLNPLRVNVRTINDYIENRLSISSEVSSLRMMSPLRFKKKKRFHDDLDRDDLINLVHRRLATLYALDDKVLEFKGEFNIEIKSKELYWKEYERYSNRQNSRMSLGGIMGVLEFGEVSLDGKKLLIAGELINLGKSTSLGLGDYILY